MSSESRQVRLAVLMTCHNRKMLTLRSVSRLLEISERLSWGDLNLFVVDDGSSDGTGRELRSRYPAVHVVRGNGTLYWARGMQRAFLESTKRRPFDGYLLVNDDVSLDVAACVNLLDRWKDELSCERVLVGTTRGPGSRDVTYGGLIERSQIRLRDFELLQTPQDQIVACDTFNANFAVIPNDFFERRNGLGSHFKHGIADLDLGLDAGKAGLGPCVLGSPIGECEKGPTTERMLVARGRGARLRMLFIGPYSLGPELYFAWKHRPRLLIAAYLLNGIRQRIFLVLRSRSR